MDHFWPFSGQNRLFWGGRGGPQNLIFIGILLFLLLRSPCKNLKPFDKPFYNFNSGTMRKKKKKRFCRRVCRRIGYNYLKYIPLIRGEREEKYIFVTPCKNLKSYDIPIWGKSKGGNKNNKRKKTPKIVATFVCASSQGQRTHSAQTNIFHVSY